jgi:hypothetical protein
MHEATRWPECWQEASIVSRRHLNEPKMENYFWKAGDFFGKLFAR